MRRRTLGLALLGLVSFVLVVAGGASSGVPGALVLLGLPLFLVGLAGVVVGHARWAYIASRSVGAGVLVIGLVLALVGGSLAPAPVADSAPGNRVAATARPSATASGSTSTPSEPSAAQSPTAPPTDAQQGASQETVPPAPAGTALALLATLEVKGRAPKTGYGRDQFGQRWADTDRNGCDTRNDILRRDLTAVVVQHGTQNCVVLSGSLGDPYSGRTITFRRGQDTSAQVQIDHVVALSDAWQKGAQQWSPARRVAFANDPLNLLAVDGGLNMQKSDGDAATWLPPNRAYRCAYVARQVAVKAKFGAWVTAAERNAIARVLSTCPNEPVPTSTAAVEAPIRVAAAPAPAGPAAPAVPVAPAAGGTCDPSYPGVCIPPVSVAGDLDCGDITYRRFAVKPPDPHGFDGNGDGVGCEG